MARQKGAVIPREATFEQIEHLLSEWIYIGYIDAGSVSPELRCECGRPLRRQHIVEHKSTGVIKKFGIHHLQDHLGLDPKTVKEIVQGFEEIDYELDEILLKIEQRWELVLPPFRHLEIPADIRQHLDLNLPLLDRQVNRLRKMINESVVQEARNVQSAATAYSSPRTSIKESQVEWIIDNDREKERAAGFSELDVQYQAAILDYLQQGMQSARIICELLIDKHRASNKRYSTGKPYIYVPVCWFIESLVAIEQCVIVSKGLDRSDRLYQWKGID